MRSTKKLLLVTLVVIASLFAFGAVAQADTTQGITFDIVPSVDTLIPGTNSITVGSLQNIAFTANATGDDINRPFQVVYRLFIGDNAGYTGIGYSADNQYGTLIVTFIDDGVTVGVVGAVTSTAFTGIINKAVLIPANNYQIYADLANIEVGTSTPITINPPDGRTLFYDGDASFDGLSHNAPYDRTSAPSMSVLLRPNTPVFTIPSTGITLITDRQTGVVEGVNSLATNNWTYVSNGPLSGTLRLNTGVLPSVPDGYKHVTLEAEYVRRNLTGINGALNIVTNATGTKRIDDALNLRAEYDVRVSYPLNQVITPMNRTATGDFDHLLITLTNVANYPINVTVRCSDINQSKSTHSEALIETLTIPTGTTRTVPFYGLKNKRVYVDGTYQIFVDAAKADGTACRVAQANTTFRINKPTAPITTDNVSWSPSPYNPGGQNLVLTVTPNPIIDILKTEVVSVSNFATNVSETSSWKLSDTTPATARSYMLSNMAASAETKIAGIRVWYPLLTLNNNLTNGATILDTPDTTTALVNANSALIDSKFSVGTRTAGLSVSYVPQDGIGKLIVPDSSGKGVNLTVSANISGIDTRIDVIPVNGTDPVMSWSWTSSDTTPWTRTWDGVISSYPKKLIDPGLYKIVASGIIKTIGANDTVVNTPVVSAEVTVNFGTVVAPSSIFFSPDSIELGKGLTFVASDILNFLPADTSSQATNKTVAYTSSDNTIAYVDATGKITAAKEGEATITATSSATYPPRTATLKITVVPPATSVTLPAQIRALVGETVKITPKFDGPAYPLTYTSSDDKLATVDKDGVVTIKDESCLADKLVIKVVCEELKFEGEIPVIGAIKATGLNVLPAGKEVACPIGAIAVPKKVAGYIQPKNAIENVAGAVTYKSSDESVVFVREDGSMIGLSNGVAVITISGAGFTDTVTVTVGTGAAAAE